MLLQLKVPIGPEEWDEDKEEFIPPPYITIEMEHTLVTISKWESKWRKAFLSKREKTSEEWIDYFKTMIVTPNINDNICDYMTEQNITDINNYIESPMSATYIQADDTGAPNKDVVTSELIYYWMTAHNIPFEECQHWHLNRLLTLIRVCNEKNAPPDKKRRKPNIEKRRAMNEARKKQFNSKG